MYLFGTIHRPFSSVWSMIPRNVKKAFKSSKKVYFEIDLTNLEDLLTRWTCKLLPNGQTLSTVLPPTTFTKLQRYLDYIRSQMPSWINKNNTQHGGYADEVFLSMTSDWQRKRPIWMLLQLTSLNKDYVRSRDIPSLDIFLFSKSQDARKKIGHIESSKEYCALNNLNSSQTIIYLNKTLTKYNLARMGKLKLPASSDLTYHYLCGNLSKFVFQQEMDDFEESLTQEMILKRNLKMTQRIIKEIRSTRNKRMFFAIGAAHLIGNGSIIDILKAKGFKTKHIKAKDVLPRRYRSRKKSKKTKAAVKFSKMSKRRPCATTFPTFSSSENHIRTTQRRIPAYVRSSAGQIRVDKVKTAVNNILVVFIVSIICQII